MNRLAALLERLRLTHIVSVNNSRLSIVTSDHEAAVLA
jgi:hypothetical protein